MQPVLHFSAIYKDDSFKTSLYILSVMEPANIEYSRRVTVLLHVNLPFRKLVRGNLHLVLKVVKPKDLIVIEKLE